MMRLSAPRNNNSCLAGDQFGELPPPDEICTFGPGPGNGRTNTSRFPDSFDSYAIQRPSDENIGAFSVNGVLRNTVGSPGFQPDASSPDMGSTMRSSFVLGRSSVYARNLPF